MSPNPSIILQCKSKPFVLKKQIYFTCTLNMIF